MISREEAENIVRQQYNTLYTFCRMHLKDQDAADDLTHEVFVLFLEKYRELDNENIRAWLFSTAEIKIKESLREQIIRSKLVSLDDCDKYTVTDPDGLNNFEEINPDDDEIEKAKAKILSRLSPEELELFIDIYQRRMKYSSIAQSMGITENAVALRSFRLKRKIQKMAELAFTAFAFVLIKLKIV